MKKLYLLNNLSIVLLSMLVSTMSYSQRVNPFQVGSYAPSLVQVRDFSATEPGLIFSLYNYWAETRSFYDENGNTLDNTTLDLSLIDPSLGMVNVGLKPELDGFITLPVIFYTSKIKILGARYMASFSPIYLSIDYRLWLYIDDEDEEVSGNSAGWGDLSFMPLGLGWTIGDKYDVAFTYTLYAPTGTYSTDRDDNVGQGFWTHQLQVPFYGYLNEKATALTLIPTLELNGKVRDRDLIAGHRFTLEYGIGQFVNNWMEVEVLNGHNWQISDDRGLDNWYDNTIFDGKDRKSTVGLGLNFWPIQETLSVRLKYTADYGLRDRFSNRIIGLSLLYISNILTEK